MNLQAASVVILMEPQLKPSTEKQAIDRAHRMGQTLPVVVYRLITENSIDEGVVQLSGFKSSGSSLAWLGEMTDAVQLGRAKPGQVPLSDLDDPDQRNVLQQPPAEKRVTGDLPISGPVAAVLDDLLVDVLGAEQAQEAGVRGRDRDCSPLGTAGVQDVVPEHVRIDHHRRRAQQDISRERAPRIGEPDRRDRTVLMHLSDRAADNAHDVLGRVGSISHASRLLNATAQATD